MNKTKLTLGDDRIGREAYDGKYNLLGLQLDAAPIMKLNAKPEISNSALRVFPNPAGRTFNVEYQSKSADEGQLRLFDAVGKQVHEQSVKVKVGMNNYQVTLQNQPESSTYILQLVNGEEVLNRKIILGEGN